MSSTNRSRSTAGDESRFGLLTIRRWRLTAQGVQPVGPVPPRFAWFYIEGPVEPSTGDRYMLALPYLHVELFHLCVEAFAQDFLDRLNLLVLNSSGTHMTPSLHLPTNVRLVFLPPMVLN